MSTYSHIPVLLQEVLFFASAKPGEVCFDATLGGGGYTKALAKAVGSKGRVIATDLDSAAIAHAEEHLPKAVKSRVTLVHSGFEEIAKIARKHEVAGFDVVVADLGLSSFQLDQSSRGFTFQNTEPLDMRFDTRLKDTAATLLADESLDNLTRIFREYGEERHARRIAKAVVAKRHSEKLSTTEDLVQLLTEVLPKGKPSVFRDSLARVFQSLRIAVNGELDRLASFLTGAIDVLTPGGRLVVVSFHSLEDRLVKRAFVAASRGCVCPVDFPQCVCGRNPAVRLLTKKPVTAGLQELQDNPRSRSAKLRAVQKV